MTEPDPATQHIDALIAELDAARADLAAATARIGELEAALRSEKYLNADQVKRLLRVSSELLSERGNEG